MTLQYERKENTSCTPSFYIHSLPYVSSQIGELHLPVTSGCYKGKKIAVCTVGEWGLRLQRIKFNCYQLDVVSFSKAEIKNIIKIGSLKDTAQSQNIAYLSSFQAAFRRAAIYSDTDTNTIQYLAELYYEFPIYELYDALHTIF